MDVLGMEIKKDHFLATFYLAIIFLVIELALITLQIYFDAFTFILCFIGKFVIMYYLATRVFNFSTKDLGGLAIAYFILFSLVELSILVCWMPENLLDVLTYPTYVFEFTILPIISSKIWQTFLYTVILGLLLYYFKEKRSANSPPHAFNA